MAERWDAVVLGAGVAGLVAAHDLARDGVRVLVLDAADRPGGTVAGASVGIGGGRTVAVDVGAESFATRTPAVGDLARELGLAVVEPDPRGAWAYAGAGTEDDPARARPLPRTATLGIPTTPWAADVRRVLGLGGALRAWWDLGMARTPVPDSLAAWVTQRLGPTALERLVAPVAGGIHSADPATLDPRAVAPQLVAAYEKTGSLLRAASMLADAPGRGNTKPGSAVAGIDGGMHRLVASLADAVRSAGGEVRLGVRVVGLERHHHDGGLWHVSGSASDGARATAAEAQRVVVALPRTPAIALVTPLLPPDLSEAGEGRASGASDNPGDGGDVSEPGESRGSPGSDRSEKGGSDVRLITLVLRAPALDDAPRGTGVLVAPGADVRAKGLTHASAKWPWLRALLPDGVHVVRLSYGRAGDPEPTLPPTVEEAVADASRLLGVPLDPSQVLDHLDTHWPDALAPARPADRSLADDAAHRLPGLTVVGSWVAGTGLAAVVGQARDAVTALAPQSTAD
ncbi:protoporphyrinogen/coproporphyrinogen oxidase [Luteimicrobium sp. DT211]|uniref:protoporphyrinogen/coproporphyrinogen oxidase n=1 Tax=Luteimicrobium sp. DT211 TaxID=3393412 RepID=UPI003CEA1183